MRLHQSNYLRSRLLRRHCAWICQDIKKLLLIGWSDLIDRRQNIWNGKCLIAVICSRILFRMACTFFSYIILCCFRDVSVVRTYVCSLRLQILPAFAINRLLLRALSAVFFLVNFCQLFPCLRRLMLFFLLNSVLAFFTLFRNPKSVLNWYWTAMCDCLDNYTAPKRFGEVKSISYLLQIK